MGAATTLVQLVDHLILLLVTVTTAPIQATVGLGNGNQATPVTMYLQLAMALIHLLEIATPVSATSINLTKTELVL